VAAHRAPDSGPIEQGVNRSRNLPIRPPCSAPLYPIDLHDEITKDELVDIQQVPDWCHIIQLRDAMGSQSPVVRRVGAGCFNDGSSGQLRDGNVIWMSVASIRPEGDDHIRLDAPQMSGDFCHDLSRMGLVQCAINVIQEIDAVDTKGCGCRS